MQVSTRNVMILNNLIFFIEGLHSLVPLNTGRVASVLPLLGEPEQLRLR